MDQQDQGVQLNPYRDLPGGNWQAWSSWSIRIDNICPDKIHNWVSARSSGRRAGDMRYHRDAHRDGVPS
jgi:hypothetical protein